MATVSSVHSSATSRTAVAATLRQIALAGNPNAGKTTLFNALTGMRQKVGNYPGVTVEKKEGRCALPNDGEATILDLPGTYSLSPKSPDEEIARDVLLGLRDDTPIPDAVVVVIDASNLERNLYLATQVLELGIPTVIALNMSDVARANGKPVDAAKLSTALGAPVVETVASRGEGLDELRRALSQTISVPQPPILTLPEKAQNARLNLARALDPVLDLASEQPSSRAMGVALRLLCGNVPPAAVRHTFGPIVAEATEEARAQCEVSPARLGAMEAQARYVVLGKIAAEVVSRPDNTSQRSVSDKLDAILTHKIWGMAIFALITLLVFQAIFSWASIPMNAIDGGVAAFGTWVSNHMAQGPLRDLIVEGVIAGVGAVLIFLPQILILFFFIGLLEDTGYMARAAFLMDRAMSRVGLHGRAFIPLMSSFACAIPGIMATRTISNRRDRMTTILIAPLMTCSARLPVYTLMIATFIPARALWGAHIGNHFFGLTLPAAIMFGLYLFGMLAAMAAAWVFKKTLFKGPPPALMMELPPYKIPAWRNIVVTMWDRASMFLKRAGTVILAISIVLWFMLSYPKLGTSQQAEAIRDFVPAQGVRPGKAMNPVLDRTQGTETARQDALSAAQLRHSFAGRIGRVIEPAIAPLGFNWKIGIGLIGAMSAREVFVSTMGTVYSVGDANETSKGLKSAMQRDRWPNGRPVWTPLVAVSLMVYFVLAMQCISTLAIVRRETNSWQWPLFMQVYMTALAWLASFGVYQIGRMLGWG
jgi:ferrous iron transport protein B